jgi:hypothetical protein
MVVVISPRHATALYLFAWFGVIALGACNAITGTGKYELVDCPSGACVDASGANGEVGTDATVPTDASTGGDTTAAADCGVGEGALTLTVSGKDAGVVYVKTGEPDDLRVAVGETKTACLAAVNGVLQLRTDDGTLNPPPANWTGPTCKDGNNAQDRCEFPFATTAVTVTATFP